MASRNGPVGKQREIGLATFKKRRLVGVIQNAETAFLEARHMRGARPGDGHHQIVMVRVAGVRILLEPRPEQHELFAGIFASRLTGGSRPTRSVATSAQAGTANEKTPPIHNGRAQRSRREGRRSSGRIRFPGW